MSTKTVQFSVEVKDLTITSGTFNIWGIVQGNVGGAIVNGTFQQSTFNANLIPGLSEYFSVMVYVTGYKTADGTEVKPDKPINMLAVLYLPDVNYTVKVTPESTIATIYAFAQMMNVAEYNPYWMWCTERQAKIAYGMKQHFYTTDGNIGDMIKNSPNGFETNSYPMFNSLCNAVYYCITDTEFYGKFLEKVWHEEGVPNTNLIEAIRHMVYDPFCNAGDIYNMLAEQPEVYTDSLTTMNVSDAMKVPNQWTLTLKANQSGAKNFIPAGAAFVVFDADDNAWIANNFRAGSNKSGTHCPVYKYDATPADFSPVQGGGLLGVGFGAAIEPNKEYISFGNFGWGEELYNPQEGSISRFYKDGTPISPSNGYTEGLSRVQGMNYDNAGNLWMASVGCQEPFAPSPIGVYPFEGKPSAAVVYMNGEPDENGKPTTSKVLVCSKFPVKHNYDDDAVWMETPFLKIFDVVPDNNGAAYVSCIGNYSEHPKMCALSAVYKVEVVDGELKPTKWYYSDWPNAVNGNKGYESLRQIAINAEGDVVVVGVAGSRATVLSSELEWKAYYTTNTHAPWGIKIAGDQTVFLANFGHETDYATAYTQGDTLDMQGPFGVTMLRNPENPESAQLLSVPSGGAEVTLANGHPLYGMQFRPETSPILIGGEPQLRPVRMKSYQPIMRLTSTNIDGAGNLWCMNNWKPSAVVDVEDNPGGDGVVIFVGIAQPE